MWYATSGTELTVEIHESKEATDLYARRLPYLYMESRDSFLNYIRNIHFVVQVSSIYNAFGDLLNFRHHRYMSAGAGFARLNPAYSCTQGEVVDDSTGESLPLDAAITLIASDGTNLIGRTTHSRAGRAGSFFRLLVPGQPYCLVVEAAGFYRHYAAVMIPETAVATPSATLQHIFKMSKTTPRTALLGEGRRDLCTYVEASNSDSAVVTSVQPQPDAYSDQDEVIEMTCEEAEQIQHPDGRVELRCINFCQGMEMEPVAGSSAFTTKCVRK